MFRAMKGVAIGLGAWLLAILIAGCGGTSEHSPPAPSVQPKCEAVLTGYCDSAVACLIGAQIVQESERDTANQGCLSQARKGLPCEHAVSVMDNYDQCLIDLKALPCGPVVQLTQGVPVDPLPATCQRVIGIQN